MSLFVFKILNLVVLLLSVAWLVSEPDWEPLVVSLGFFITFVGQEYKLYKQLSQLNVELPKVLENNVSPSYVELFQKFREVLPSDGETIDFLEDHDLGNSFHSDKLKGIDLFILNWNNADHEFSNKQLEDIRITLLNQMEEFRNKLSLAIQSQGHGWFSIGLNDFEDRPEMFALKNELNQMATGIFETHQQLVRTGKVVLCS
ncbi:hypothetical protein [Vibrio crassostreae]|uniref:hypothetical protein n=1 Tax=Vibrio crassostreae TaxID=246167 RepID=UPI00104394E6|nr:hypothetical protein [Vibrio crassostreae]TCV23599.1 hypothetical protein EDB71_1136 [Vibrio crassostreae]